MKLRALVQLGPMLAALALVAVLAHTTLLVDAHFDRFPRCSRRLVAALEPVCLREAREAVVIALSVGVLLLRGAREVS